MSTPWIHTAADLARVLAQDNASAGTHRDGVLWNRSKATVPVGHAVREILRGRTATFTMLTGFFSPPIAGRDDPDSPLRILRDEAAEELAAWRDADAPDAPRFRLLLGALGADRTLARRILAGWVWLCAWHRQNPADASRWLSAIDTAAQHIHRSLPALESDPEHVRPRRRDAFSTLARNAFSAPHATPPHDAALTPADPPPLPILAPTFTFDDPTTHATFATWRDEWLAPDLTPADPTAAELLLFLALRRAVVRIQPPGHGFFHGKLFLAERESGGTLERIVPDAVRDTCLLMGSANFSAAAFTASARANTEIAALLRTPGWHWTPAHTADLPHTPQDAHPAAAYPPPRAASHAALPPAPQASAAPAAAHPAAAYPPPRAASHAALPPAPQASAPTAAPPASDEEASLALRLIHTCRAAFEDAPLLAAWGHPDLPPPEEALRLLEAADIGPLLASPKAIAEPEVPAADRIPSAHVPLAHAVLDTIERLLGFSPVDDGERARLQRHLHVRDDAFAGRRPASAQVDGALRLLDLLAPPSPDNPGDWTGRGAFLADEAGLGKTLVSQMAAFAILAEHLESTARSRNGDDPAAPWPRMAILAPRQLAVGGDGEEGQWQRHRLELLDELRLHPWNEDVRDTILGWIDQERRTPPGKGSLRVLSHSILNNRIVDDEGVTTPRTLDALAHIAASDLVLIDECHAFRNGGARRTRLLRLLLTLPVPGENWPVHAGSPDDPNTRIAPADPLPASARTRRRVLGLSATPFNNRFDDLVTQLGHFARVQSWAAVLPATQLALDGLDHPVARALARWASPLAPPDPAAAHDPSLPHAHRDALQLLLRQIATPPEGSATDHLSGSRRLDPPDDRLTRDGDPMEQRARDGGPLYHWPEERYPALAPALAQIAEALRQRTASDARDDDARTHLDEAMLRLDTLLGRLFVQRSRARVIRLMDEADASAQFRAPFIPRVPLPLNQPDPQAFAFERDVLSRLWELLGSEGDPAGPDAAPDDPLPDGLTLFAYDLAARRGQEEDGERYRQTAGNVKELSAMGFVKRLQSSRWAFLQTLLRGPLRKTLQEMVLADALLRNPRLRARAGVPDHVASRLPAITREVAASVARLERDLGYLFQLAFQPTTVPDTLDLKRPELATVLGLPDPGPEGLRAEELAQALLGRKRAERMVERLDGAPWIADAAYDLAGRDAPSRLLHDVRIALTWACEGPDHRTLAARVLPREILADRSLRAFLATPRPFRGLLDALALWLADHAPPDPDRDEKIVGWLFRQLKDEPRSRGLLTFLLAQGICRTLRRRSPDSPLVPRAGERSLVFTEYADTIDYLRLLFLAASRIPHLQDPPPIDGVPRDARLDTLRRLILQQQQDLGDAVRPIQNAPPSAARANPAAYAPPLPADALAALSPTRFREALLDTLGQLATTTAWRTADQARRIDEIAREEGTSPGDGRGAAPGMLPEPPAPDSDDPLADEEEPALVPATPEDESVIDAFSPLYRVEPAAAGEADSEEALARLERAVARPVYTLIATEVLAEGVNLQECGVVIHYDLPWNPTRLIQRNGRVDRRIQPAYEDPVDRAELLARLDPVRGPKVDRALRYLAPAQVYHLSVVPPEPVVDSARATRAAERVRQALFAKLSTIQMLFGLSQWPVVLDHEEARRVLSGELDVETPGFRRREELFARYNEIRERLAAAEGEAAEGEGAEGEDGTGERGSSVALAGRGTFEVRLAPGLRAAVAARFVRGETGAAWERLAAAGIQLWHPADSGPRVTARSGIEWPAEPDPSLRGVASLTGWCMLAPRAPIGEDWQPWLLRWGRQELEGRVGRDRVTPMLVAVAAHGESILPARPVLVDPDGLDPLTAADAAHRVDVRHHPSSPAAAAEELLDVLATALLRPGQVRAVSTRPETDEQPALPPVLPPTAAPLLDAALAALGVPATADPTGTFRVARVRASDAGAPPADAGWNLVLRWG